MVGIQVFKAGESVSNSTRKKKDLCGVIQSNSEKSDG